MEKLKQQIEIKKSLEPHIFFPIEIETDYDTFPYPRWFKGEFLSDNPIVAEREAGYRKRRDSCYTPLPVGCPDTYPIHCFSSACSTTFPCHLNTKK